MISLMSIIFIFHFLSSLFGNAEGALTFNVLKFGAKPDGESDSTQAFLRAWESACTSSETSTIHVPNGRHLIRSVKFEGPCKSSIKVQIDGTLVAPANYRDIGNPGYWIVFIHSISFISVNHAYISGLTSINSQLMHIVISGCNNVKLSNVKVSAPALSPNTDGIHVTLSTGVTIINSNIGTGDDCISIGHGSRNLWFDRIRCGPGHGISIGSLGRDFNEDGVENVTLINSVFSGSDNGLRIKTWARPSKGFVRNINYRNIVMNNVENPIIIDQNYCPNNQGCPRQPFKPMQWNQTNRHKTHIYEVNKSTIFLQKRWWNFGWRDIAE
ncbi:hypothetical protein ACS0TY_026150 [Phlomoides rotata]